jgi:hypothetical protein
VGKLDGEEVVGEGVGAGVSSEQMAVPGLLAQV